MAPASAQPPAPAQEQALGDGTVLRPLSDRKELEDCAELQYRIWGAGFADVTSPAILQIAQALGGVAAGAFAPAGELLGFVFGITGIRGGRPVHWSHMLAVLPEARGRDLGFHLKVFQRRLVLPLGVESMEWTYDPLVAKNAYLNLARLGARPVRYLRDYYGAGDDSELSAGIGTDRFVVEWRIGEARVARAIAGEAPGEAAGGAPPIVNVTGAAAPEGPGEPVVIEPLAAPVVRVEVPADVHQVRREAPERAARWRASTRAAFEALLARGYTVEGFEREPVPSAGGPRRSYYVMRSPR